MGEDAMGEVVNLRKARKAAARRRDEIDAVENRARFGRSKTERVLQKAQSDKRRRELDAHRIDTEDGR